MKRQFKDAEYKTGEVYTIAWKYYKEPPYPWNPKQHIPIRIINDYGRWVLCEVLPHKAEPFNFGESKPYRITIDKIDIANNYLSIY